MFQRIELPVHDDSTPAPLPGSIANRNSVSPTARTAKAPAARAELFRKFQGVLLDRLPVGVKGRLVRILDANPALLAYIDGLSVSLGDEIEVVNQEPFGGPLIVSVGGRKRSLGRLAAAALSVESQS